MRIHRYRVVLTCLMIVAAMCLIGFAQAPSTDSPVRDGVFVHIKSGPDQAHSVLMGLRMAQIMAAEHDVLVYFDVAGIGVVLADSPDLAMQPFGSAQAMIDDLNRQGVSIYACPGCLQAAGKTPDQLMPQVQVAQKEAFFSFTKGRILTLDY